MRGPGVCLNPRNAEKVQACQAGGGALRVVVMLVRFPVPFARVCEGNPLQLQGECAGRHDVVLLALRHLYHHKYSEKVW